MDSPQRVFIFAGEFAAFLSGLSLRTIRPISRHEPARQLMSALRQDRQMSAPAGDELEILRELEKKVLWLASWTIHHANHLRENSDGLKVGGHQASSASLAAIMTALYFH